MRHGEEAIVSRLEELGEEQVRHLLSIGGLPPSWNVTAALWLAKEDRPAREDKKKEAEAAFAIGLAASAQKAAWVSAFASIAAALLALTSIIVTLRH